MSGEIREAVRQRYAGFAVQISGSGCCDESGCCSSSEAIDPSAACGTAYSADELKEVGIDDGVSLGAVTPRCWRSWSLARRCSTWVVAAAWTCCCPLGGSRLVGMPTVST